MAGGRERGVGGSDVGDRAEGRDGGDDYRLVFKADELEDAYDRGWAAARADCDWEHHLVVSAGDISCSCGARFEVFWWGEGDGFHGAILVPAP